MVLIFTLVVLAQHAQGRAETFSTTQDEPKKLHALFDDEWQWTLREYPEVATRIGDPRFNDRLMDLSARAIEARKTHKRDLLKRIREIDRASLMGQDALSYDLFLRETEQSIALQRFPSEFMPISQMNGVHISIPELPRVAPLRTVKNYEDFLTRLEAYPHQVDQVIELLKSGIAASWLPPEIPLRKVPPQLAKQLGQDVKKSPLFKPFESFPEAIGPADRSRLEARALDAIKGSIVPALERLHQFIAETYVPRCRKDIAATNFPDGAAYYQAQIRLYTTTDLSARAIHEIGIKEVKRIRAEMDAVIKETGFSGSFQEFLTLLRTDPRFARMESDQVLPAFRDIAKRVDPELPKLFAELPRTPYGIREIPAYQGETAEHYTRGAADASRAGYFNANVQKGATRRKYEMEALLLHEAVPGHHLQVSRAQELKDLPDFRRTSSYSAYGEGWALYAEGLGEELGLYKDPYSKFGRLNGEIHRACRLVVDTGMHAMGWSRDQALNYLKENSGLSESFIEAEIDRYIVWPAQALAYKLGELKIKELRAELRSRSEQSSTSGSSTTRSSTTGRFPWMCSNIKSNSGSRRNIESQDAWTRADPIGDWSRVIRSECRAQAAGVSPLEPSGRSRARPRGPGPAPARAPCRKGCP